MIGANMSNYPEPEQDRTIQAPEGSVVSADPASDFLITIQIEQQFEDRVDADALEHLAVHVLQAEGRKGPLELGVIVTTDQEVRALNVQYLGHDYDTDVISFSMADEDAADGFLTPTDRPPYLGDVVISYERAFEQAPDYGYTTPREVANLLVHGILHLLGWDDSTDELRAKMQARQEDQLRSAAFEG
jgi:probable rRNA maturation factor